MFCAINNDGLIGSGIPWLCFIKNALASYIEQDTDYRSHHWTVDFPLSMRLYATRLIVQNPEVYRHRKVNKICLPPDCQASFYIIHSTVFVGLSVCRHRFFFFQFPLSWGFVFAGNDCRSSWNILITRRINYLDFLSLIVFISQVLCYFGLSIQINCYTSDCLVVLSRCRFALWSIVWQRRVQ